MVGLRRKGIKDWTTCPNARKKPMTNTDLSTGYRVSYC